MKMIIVKTMPAGMSVVRIRLVTPLGGDVQALRFVR